MDRVGVVAVALGAGVLVDLQSAWNRGEKAQQTALGRTAVGLFFVFGF
jgi:hypothetical protein